MLPLQKDQLGKYSGVQTRPKAKDLLMVSEKLLIFASFVVLAFVLLSKKCNHTEDASNHLISIPLANQRPVGNPAANEQPSVRGAQAKDGTEKLIISGRSSKFSPPPEDGYYFEPVLSEVPCKSWFKPSFNLAQVDTHSTESICRGISGWSKKRILQDSEECRAWFNEDAGRLCWKRYTPKKIPSTATDLVKAYVSTSKNYLSNVLSCNDPAESAARFDISSFNLKELAESKPARTLKQVQMWESCFVYPFCKSIKASSIYPGYKYYRDGFSQSGQDRLVASHFKYKRNGVYLDIGASDGVEMSNSFLLDKCYGWTGLSVDANWMRYMGLARARRGGDTVYGCVHVKDTFESFTLGGGLSSVDSLDENTEHIERRKKGIKKMMKANVPCYDFNKLVRSWMDFRGIKVIDYLSIDIEGAEWNALKLLNLDTLPIRVIGIEVPYTNKAYVKKLTDAGYRAMNYKKVGDQFWEKDIA